MDEAVGREPVQGNKSSNPRRGGRTAAHAKLVLILGVGSAVAALLSVAAAFWLRAHDDVVSPMIGQLLVAGWVLLPPLWFLVEWAMFSDELSDYGRDRLKHMHDLARNFWVGLVTVLAAILEFGPFHT